MRLTEYIHETKREMELEGGGQRKKYTSKTRAGHVI